MSKTIGFVGLGAMGLPVAINLQKKGFEVIGFDIDQNKRDVLETMGVMVVSSLDSLFERADCIVTMLPEGHHVDSVVEHFLSTKYTVKLFIDLSTIGIDYAKKVQTKLFKKGVDFLEAPVTGGVKGATDGTLTVMVAGDETVFNENRSIFDSFGSFVVFAGAPGCAQAAKLCNNMAAGIIKVAISEAFALSKRLGVSDEVMFKVASKGSANCFALTQTCPVPGLVASAPSTRGYINGFATKLMLKDMLLAQNAAATVGVPVTVASAASSIYQHCCNNGLENFDNSIVFKFISND